MQKSLIWYILVLSRYLSIRLGHIFQSAQFYLFSIMNNILNNIITVFAAELLKKGPGLLTYQFHKFTVLQIDSHSESDSGSNKF